MIENAAPTLVQDEEAMRRVARGDAEALALLFDRHKARLGGFLYHLCGDITMAEDLVSDTFLRLYEARRSYRPECAFLPWLYRIARNLALGEMRKRAVRRRSIAQLAESEGLADSPEPGRIDAQDQVRRALRELPEDQRTALMLKEYDELEYKDIGLILGCSEEAARARTYRARQTMRCALREWWES